MRHGDPGYFSIRSKTPEVPNRRDRLLHKVFEFAIKANLSDYDDSNMHFLSVSFFDETRSGDN